MAATGPAGLSSLSGHLNTPPPETIEDRLWHLIQTVAGFVSGKVSRRPVQLRDRNLTRRTEHSNTLEGTEEDADVELEDREDRPMIP